MKRLGLLFTALVFVGATSSVAAAGGNVEYPPLLPPPTSAPAPAPAPAEPEPGPAEPTPENVPPATTTPTAILPTSGGDAPTPTTTPTAILPTSGGDADPASPGGAAGTPAGSLPSTGSSGISSNLAIAGMLLAAGLGLMIVAGVRKRTPAATS